MSLARIYIAAFLLVLVFCNAETTSGSGEIKVNDSNGGVADNAAADAPKMNAKGGEKKDEEEEEDKEERDGAEEVLPILPPIILLDFDNGTVDDNATVDEKSKRTVNDGLGYGFGRNSLPTPPRKYNYYFPAGKTGTTVSIEESISPFLPRTIIEKVPAINQKPVADSYVNLDRRQQVSYKSRDSTGTSFQNSADYQYYDPAAAKSQSPQVFGLRTKLTKTSNSEPYRGFAPIARPTVETSSYPHVDSYRDGAYVSTTSQSAAFGPTETAGYATPTPQGYTVASSSSRYAYVTPSPSSYAYVTPSPSSYAEVHSQTAYLGQSNQHAINVQGYAGSAQSAIESSTPNPLDSAVFLENVGAQTQVNSHDYVRAGANTVESSTAGSDGASGYGPENAGPFAELPRYTVENGVRYENKIFWKYPDGRVSDVPPMTYETYSEYPSLAALQAAKSREASQVYESVSTENSALSQGPAQFPMAPESGAPPTPFISAESLSKLPQQQVYRLGYQNLVGPKQIVSQQTKAGVSSAYSVPSTTPSPRNSLKSIGKIQKSRYEAPRRPITTYRVNSPNPEYVSSYTTERGATAGGRPFASSVNGNLAKKINGGGKDLENYSNLQYADLLNYNPSISQYIKNPASILNVQPTFVQAGSSLIPVIILRVDGVPPIQAKATPNVNLKALLQQYLVQYARSIEELARPSNYDFGNDQSSMRDQSSFSTSPLRELARLTQNTAARDLIGNPTESYVGRSSYEASNLNVGKNPSSAKYGERTAARPKVKSVQIVEDPRFPNYKIKN